MKNTLMLSLSFVLLIINLALIATVLIVLMGSTLIINLYVVFIYIAIATIISMIFFHKEMKESDKEIR